MNEGITGTTNSMRLAEYVQDEQMTALSDEYRPIIGIPIPVQQGQQGPLLLADAVGAWSVERMKGRVFLIPLWPFPTHKHIFQSLWPLLSSLDGLLLPAGLPGNDWYTQWLARENTPDPKIWPLSWEMALTQLATYIGVPILAIGDGAERWNVALGGSTVQVSTKVPQPVPVGPEAWEHQTIRVRANSKLATWMQHPVTEQGEKEEQKPWTLSAMPSQGIEKLALGLRACAQSDATIVAFERRDPTFGLGILPRVDWGLDQTYSELLFDAFMQSCRAFASTRQRNTSTWEASRETICETVYERVMHNQPLLPVSSPQSTGRTHPTGQLNSKNLSNEGVQGMSVPEKQYRHLRQQPSIDELRKARKLRLKASVR